MARFRSKTISNAFQIKSRFNNKINRLKRKGVSTNLLPSTISNQELVTIINNSKSSRDLKFEIKKMERFIKRGGERVIEYEGEEMLKSDKENLISAKRSAIARLRTEIKLELDRIGNPITYEELKKRPRLANFYGVSLGNAMQKLESVRLATGTKTYKQILYEKYTRDSDKWLNFRNNFIQMIIETGYFYGAPEEEIRAVVKRIKQLSGRNFAVAYRRNKWIEEMIYGYHIVTEFDISQNFTNERGIEHFFGSWEEFKDSINLVVDETLVADVDAYF